MTTAKEIRERILADFSISHKEVATTLYTEGNPVAGWQDLHVLCPTSVEIAYENAIRICCELGMAVIEDIIDFFSDRRKVDIAVSNGPEMKEEFCYRVSFEWTDLEVYSFLYFDEPQEPDDVSEEFSRILHKIFKVGQGDV